MLRTTVAVVVLAVAPLSLASCGGDDASGSAAAGQPSRTIDITATEYAFNGDPGTITAGDTVEFSLENVGVLDHLLEVLSSEGRSLGRTQRLPAGGTDSIVVTFETAGTYRLICDVDDHLSRGQTATITVD